MKFVYLNVELKKQLDDPNVSKDEKELAKGLLVSQLMRNDKTIDEDVDKYINQKTYEELLETELPTSAWADAYEIRPAWSRMRTFSMDSEVPKNSSVFWISSGLTFIMSCRMDLRIRSEKEAIYVIASVMEFFFSA